MRPGPPSSSRRRPARRQQHQHTYNITSNRHNHHHGILGDIGRVNTWAILFLLLLVSGTCLALIETSYNQLDHMESKRIDQHATSKSLILDRSNRKPRNLTIGYLTAIKGGLKDRQGLAISGAISMALDEVCLFFF